MFPHPQVIFRGTLTKCKRMQNISMLKYIYMWNIYPNGQPYLVPLENYSQTAYGKGQDSQGFRVDFLPLLHLLLFFSFDVMAICVSQHWCPVFHLINYILFLIIVNFLFTCVTTVLCVTIVNLGMV
jgi:hypothetical protein